MPSPPRLRAPRMRAVGAIPVTLPGASLAHGVRMSAAGNEARPDREASPPMLTMPSGHKVLILDAFVALWVLAWILVGVLTAQTVGQLTELSTTFGTVGGAVGSVGETLGGIDVPLLPDPLKGTGEAIETAGRDIVARGLSLREKVERISVGAGFVVALVPALSLLMLYAPARLARARETIGLRTLLRAQRGDAALESFLARRAVERASYWRLRRVSSRPWEIEAADTRRALAEEELRRLGVSRRALRGGSQ